jgi:hypothetical protein
MVSWTKNMRAKSIMVNRNVKKITAANANSINDCPSSFPSTGTPRGLSAALDASWFIMETAGK